MQLFNKSYYQVNDSGPCKPLVCKHQSQRLRNHRSRCINLHKKISYHNDSCYFDILFIAVNVHLWTLVLGPEHIDPLHWKPSLVLLKTLFSLTLIVWIFKMIKWLKYWNLKMIPIVTTSIRLKLVCCTNEDWPMHVHWPFYHFKNPDNQC
jgi:hypothetical protein